MLKRMKKSYLFVGVLFFIILFSAFVYAQSCDHTSFVYGEYQPDHSGAETCQSGDPVIGNGAGVCTPIGNSIYQPVFIGLSHLTGDFNLTTLELYGTPHINAEFQDSIVQILDSSGNLMATSNNHSTVNWNNAVSNYSFDPPITIYANPKGANAYYIKFTINRSAGGFFDIFGEGQIGAYGNNGWNSINSLNPSGNPPLYFYTWGYYLDDGSGNCICNGTVANCTIATGEGTAPSFMKDLTDIFVGLFPPANSLSLLERFGFVAVTMLIFTLLIYFFAWKSGNSELGGAVTIGALVVDVVLFFFFTAVGYIPLGVIVVIVLILLALAYFRVTKGGN